jgi:hypothetical protein
MPGVHGGQSAGHASGSKSRRRWQETCKACRDHLRLVWGMREMCMLHRHEGKNNASSASNRALAGAAKLGCLRRQGERWGVGFSDTNAG